MKRAMLKLKQDIENDIVDEEKFEKYFWIRSWKMWGLSKRVQEKLTVRIKSQKEILADLAPTVVLWI